MRVRHSSQCKEYHGILSVVKGDSQLAGDTSWATAKSADTGGPFVTAVSPGISASRVWDAGCNRDTAWEKVWILSGTQSLTTISA